MRIEQSKQKDRKQMDADTLETSQAIQEEICLRALSHIHELNTAK
jgi:hypothetical protein